MGRYFLTCVRHALKPLILLVVVYIGFKILLSGKGMPTLKDFIINVLDFVGDQLHIVIHWAQQCFGWN